MTVQYAVEWVSWVLKMPPGDVMGLGLTDDQLIAIGRGLAANRLLNPPKDKPLKTGTFVCSCGCGETFIAEYRTAKPKYKNEAHRMRYWRREMKRRGV